MVVNSTLPLEGVTVVDITQVVAGPFATMTLGDLGAEIIKIEMVGRGDRSRNLGPIPEYFDTINRNKQSVAVDLKSDKGRRIVREMVRDADVFIESMKPGRTAAFDLTYEQLRDLNPALVYCSISGFGSDSPYQNLPAWDMLIQAMSGVMGMTGEADGSPVWSGLPSGDLMASMYTVQSVLAALYARHLGIIETEHIQVSMLDSAISSLCVRAGYTFGRNEPFPRTGDRHPSISPFGAFSCEDERIVIAAGTPTLWEDFCAVLGREDLLTDERFSTVPDRCENVDELTALIEDELAGTSADEWIRLLQSADIPAGPIHDTKSVWEDPHVKERNLHQRMERPNQEPADVIDHPVRFSSLSTELDRAPEQLGESTNELLTRYGYDEKTIEQLRTDGVVE